MDKDEIAAHLENMIAECERVMHDMRIDKPSVVDSHSDGKRVRYARTETRRETLQTVLAMLR